MLTACIGWLEDNWRDPSQQRTSSNSPGPAAHGYPGRRRPTGERAEPQPQDRGPSTGCPAADPRRRQMKGLHP